MRNLQNILECAEKLNNSEDREECSKIVIDINKSFNLDYNLATIVFVMHLNKILSLEVKKIDEVEDYKYPNIIEELESDISSYCEKIIDRISNILNNDLEDKKIYIEYLKKLSDGILYAFKYKEYENNFNTMYYKEEFIYDRMMILVKKKVFKQFTLKYKIQVPFMYTFVWDIRNIVYNYENTKFKENSVYEKKDVKPDGSYYSSLRSNIKYYLKELDNNCLEIIFFGWLKDCKNYNRKKIIRYTYTKVDFTELLPVLVEADNDYQNDSDCYNKYHFIKKEIFKAIPLIPTRIAKKKISLIHMFKFITDALYQENENDKFKELLNGLIEKLNLDIKDNVELDKLTNKISDFLINNRKLILNLSEKQYDEKYEKILDKLIEQYENYLNPSTISDIEASRDLSRIAHDKMDLILMPIFRSMEKEINEKIFDMFFNNFKGLKCISYKNIKKEFKETARKFEQRNVMLGNIEYYNQYFLESIDENTLPNYFYKFLQVSNSFSNYCKMISVFKEYKCNELTLSNIRNAIAHREQKKIEQFSKTIITDVMNVLVEAPNKLFYNIIEIYKNFCDTLSEQSVVPTIAMHVKVFLEDNQWCFKLEDFTYKCKLKDKEKIINVGEGLIDRYDELDNIWIIRAIND